MMTKTWIISVLLNTCISIWCFIQWLTDEYTKNLDFDCVLQHWFVSRNLPFQNVVDFYPPISEKKKKCWTPCDNWWQVKETSNILAELFDRFIRWVIHCLLSFFTHSIYNLTVYVSSRSSTKLNELVIFTCLLKTLFGI